MRDLVPRQRQHTARPVLRPRRVVIAEFTGGPADGARAAVEVPHGGPPPETVPLAPTLVDAVAGRTVLYRRLPRPPGARSVRWLYGPA